MLFRTSHIICHKTIDNHLCTYTRYKWKKTMKLNLLFIVMDVLTVVAYPLVFLYGKLHQFLNSRA
jgi:hypothetical protein